MKDLKRIQQVVFLQKQKVFYLRSGRTGDGKRFFYLGVLVPSLTTNLTTINIYRFVFSKL